MPDWAEPVARYILEEGLPATLRVAAIAVVGSTADRHRARDAADDPTSCPSASLIRLYVEVFRGLPILVTVFIVYFGLPSIWRDARVLAAHRDRDRAHPLGQRAGRRGDARRRRSRSRASSTRRPRRSASAGSAATRS